MMRIEGNGEKFVKVERPIESGWRKDAVQITLSRPYHHNEMVLSPEDAVKLATEILRLAQGGV